MSVPFKVDLNGKVAVVTGGGGVLCGAMAKALAECGAAVAVADLKLENAQKVVDQITAAGGKAMAVACNALEKESLEAANAQIEATLGPVAILINGAVIADGPPSSVFTEENLTKTFGGSIVSIESLRAVTR